eukprot:6202572-Pleurochrysis_carterae.AAC.5
MNVELATLNVAACRDAGCRGEGDENAMVCGSRWIGFGGDGALRWLYRCGERQQATNRLMLWRRQWLRQRRVMEKVTATVYMTGTEAALPARSDLRAHSHAWLEIVRYIRSHSSLLSLLAFVACSRWI